MSEQDKYGDRKKAQHSLILKYLTKLTFLGRGGNLLDLHGHGVLFLIMF